MENIKRKVYVSILTLGTIGIVSALFSSNLSKKFETLAESCQHTHVEHYDGVINGTKGSVEHWACCECHTAWADANKTIVIGNTIDNRSKIELNNIGVRYNVDWGAGKCEPCFDANRGYYFKNYITNLEKDERCAIETINSAFKLDANESIGSFGRITNKTSQVIRVDIHKRAWGDRVYSEYLGVNETKDFFVDISAWNSEQSGENYGYAILCYNTEKQEAGGYIEVTKPEYEFPLKKFVDHLEDGAWHAHSNVYDPIYGGKLKIDLSAGNHNPHFQNRVLIDETLYDGLLVDVFNDSNKDSNSGNIWSEDWHGHVCQYKSLKKGEWSTIFIPNFVWNADNQMVSIYDLGLDTGYLYFANFRYAEKDTGKIVFGDVEGEDFTIESSGSGWATAPKTTAFRDNVNTKVHSIDYPGTGSIASNHGKTLDTMHYSNIYFYIFNGTGASIQMYSTPDWKHKQYYTLEPGVWTKCSIPVDEWNIAATHYFYPTAKAGNILISYFYGEEVEQLQGYPTQYIDLNIGTDGSIDTEKQVTLDLVNDTRVKSIDLVKYNGQTISTSEKINVSTFGKIYGEAKFDIAVTTDNGPGYVEYPVMLCSKLISSKEDLDNFPLIAGALGNTNKLIYDGYFALANDIQYSANWESFITKNILDSADFNYLKFDPNSGFVGTFDGCGHTIDGLHVYPTNGDWNGNSFIYKIGQTGVIKNVGFTNARLTAAGGYVASLGEGTIRDVYVKYSNTADYSDGLATFFYNDRGNETANNDTSYKDSLPMNVINCFVDASNIALGGKSNTHLIGSKKFGYVNLQNVFALADNSLIENATLTKTGDLGSFTSSDLSKNKAVINDIYANLTASIYAHDGVTIPNQYSGAENTDNFINNGNTDYAIYGGADLSDEELEAISMLNSKIRKMTNARIYVSLSEQSPSSTCAISLDKNTELGGDYKITIDNSKNIKLSYSNPKTLYKECLKLLEIVFGYKNFNLNFEYIPTINGTVNLTSQEVVYNAFSGDLCVYTATSKERQELSGYTLMDETFVNVKSNYQDDLCGQYHNGFFYLPPELYYSSHPSWYTPNMESYGGYYMPKNGIHYSNLCFSANGNESELALMKDEFYARLKINLLNNPNLNDICVSGNDNDQGRHDTYRTCSVCQSLNNENIAVLSFLNDMSQRIKNDPDFAGRDIYLYTMAYRDTIEAPNASDIVCDDHVGIWYTPIECNFAYAMNDEVNNAQTYADIQRWLAITKNISFYLYNVNFMRPLSPFFLFESMVENMKFMKSINARHVYYCDVFGNTSKTAFGAFTEYIISRMSLDTDLTYEELKDDFFGVDGYYGEAGERLEYYFDQLVSVMNNNKADYGEVYNAYTINNLKNYLGSMNFWYSYSIEEALTLLDPTNPYYETYKKNIETEGLMLRYLKYVAGNTWFSGDSKTKFIEDCKSHGINYIQENKPVSSTELDKQKL